MNRSRKLLRLIAIAGILMLATAPFTWAVVNETQQGMPVTPMALNGKLLSPISTVGGFGTLVIVLGCLITKNLMYRVLTALGLLLAWAQLSQSFTTATDPETSARWAMSLQAAQDVVVTVESVSWVVWVNVVASLMAVIGLFGAFVLGKGTGGLSAKYERETPAQQEFTSDWAALDAGVDPTVRD